MVLHCMVTEFASPWINNLSDNAAQPAFLSVFSAPYANFSSPDARFYPTAGNATFSDSEE